MSILGVIVRSRAADAAALRERLAALPGVDVALDPGDGRLILVMEDAAGGTAAARLGEIALWPTVINTSLVYEYSGPDLPDAQAGVADYSDWRSSLGGPGAGRPRAP